ncbi:hypothetical protein [Streptomyces sp. NPDC051162]|uniref:hypothetical protein n=1 Tax=Streptomyces sp. NPDC051162 TaxID=3154747 RepID=UPI0034133174
MIGELLPAGVESEAVHHDLPRGRLEPECAIAGAVDSRRREFETVRQCARAALRRLGIAYWPIVHGSPGWPTGWWGA